MTTHLTLFLVLLSACGKDEPGPSPTAPPPAPPEPPPVAAPCPPGQVLLDGQPVALPHGFAIHDLRYKNDNWVVFLEESDQITCEDVLATVSLKRAKQKELRVQTGSFEFVGTQASDMVFFLGDTRSDVKLALEAKSETPGGKVAICVRDPVEISLAMLQEYAGRTAKVQGLFEGAFCGTAGP